MLRSRLLNRRVKSGTNRNLVIKLSSLDRLALPDDHDSAVYTVTLPSIFSYM